MPVILNILFLFLAVFSIIQSLNKTWSCRIKSFLPLHIKKGRKEREKERETKWNKTSLGSLGCLHGHMTYVDAEVSSVKKALCSVLLLMSWNAYTFYLWTCVIQVVKGSVEQVPKQKFDVKYVCLHPFVAARFHMNVVHSAQWSQSSR